MAFVSLYAASADRPIEFVGYMRNGAETSFLLKDVSSGSLSGWLKLGQAFRDFELERHDTARDTLILLRGSDRLEVALAQGRVRDAQVESGKRGEIQMSPTAVRIGGAVANEIAIEPGATLTLADLIAAAGGIKEGSRMSPIRITRRMEDGSIEIHEAHASNSADPAKRAAAFVLRSGDTVFVGNQPNGSKDQN